jgi:uncharacterized protein involved in oxidation of intracellular sulfur
MGEDRTQVLVIINDGPYGNERAYNGLRLAMNLAKSPRAVTRLFFIGDGVSCAHNGQKTSDGYYNVERMARSLARRGEVAVWGSCMAARGLGPENLIEGVQQGSMDLLGEWTLVADQTIVF